MCGECVCVVSVCVRVYVVCVYVYILCMCVCVFCVSGDMMESMSCGLSYIRGYLIHIDDRIL